MESAQEIPVPIERLRAVSEHLHYEIDMWCASRDMLADRLWADVDGQYRKDTAQNALLEAFTIHTRALMDFLYLDAQREDDVSARHFFTDDEWDAMIAALEPAGAGPRNLRSNAHSLVLKRARDRVGKEIAHLTYKRLDPEVEGKLWPTAEIVDALSTDLFRFIDQVPQERVHEGFKTIALFVGSPPEEHQSMRLNEPHAIPGPASAATQMLPPRS